MDRKPKFKVGDRVVYPSDSKWNGVIDKVNLEDYIINYYNRRATRYESIEDVDNSFIFEEIYNSPLYKVMNET